MIKKFTAALIVGLVALAAGFWILVGILLHRFSQADFRFTIVNDTEREIHYRLLSSESNIGHVIGRSSVLKAGGIRQNFGALCVYIENEDGKVVDSINTSVGLFEALKLDGKQKEFRLNDPHEQCNIQKEDVKNCYLGKMGIIDASECP